MTLLGHRPLSQRSFLWPKRLTAGCAAAKEASSGAVGPGEALGTLVTISGYVKRPRYAHLNTPMGADGPISYVMRIIAAVALPAGALKKQR